MLLLLNRLLLLGLLLRDVLLLLVLLHVLLGMLPWMLRMLPSVLSMGRVLLMLLLLLLLLLGRVLRHGHGRLDGARMLLVVLLSGSLRCVSTGVIDRIVATTHVRLGLRMSVMLLLAIPGVVSSERRLVLCLHWYRGLRLRRPCWRLLLNNPPLLH